MSVESEDFVAHARLVAIRTFLNSIEAELARSALEAAGIESLLRADDAGGLEPPLQMTRGVQLLVRAENAGEAEAVLLSEMEDAADAGDR